MEEDHSQPAAKAGPSVTETRLPNLDVPKSLPASEDVQSEDPIPTPSPQTTISPETSQSVSALPTAESSSTPHLSGLSLQSYRPAPPSPASSRPASTIISPDPSSTSLSAAAAGGGRERSGSNSSRAGRRVSTASSGGRLSLRPRPRSTLGASFSVPESDILTPEATTPSEVQQVVGGGGGGVAEGVPDTIPEGVALPQHDEVKPAEIKVQAVEEKEEGKAVVIRDFAFVASDDRHHGRGPIIEKPDRNRDSGGGFKWSWRGAGGDDEAGEGEGGEGSKTGWNGGFGLLGGWRGFSRKGEGESSTIGGTGEEVDDEEYFSSPDPSESGLDLDDDNDNGVNFEYTVLEALDKPKGLYRAAYPFDALTPNEIELLEGDLLNVQGRGNGDPGWVVAKKVRYIDGRLVNDENGNGKMGLVPEGYLERIEIIGL